VKVASAMTAFSTSASVNFDDHTAKGVTRIIDPLLAEVDPVLFLVASYGLLGFDSGLPSFYHPFASGSHLESPFRVVVPMSNGPSLNHFP